MAPANPIEQSLELAAERCEDLTPHVYRRLFREHPEAEGMFRTEGSELVRGSMLALTIDAIMDFAGDRSGHFRLIECEVQSHDAYGTPRTLLRPFSAWSPIPCATFSEPNGRRKSTKRGGNCWARSIRSSRAQTDAVVRLKLWLRQP